MTRNSTSVARPPAPARRPAGPGVRRLRSLYLALLGITAVSGAFGAAEVFTTTDPVLKPLASGLAVLFTILFCWIGANFWIAAIGTVQFVRQSRLRTSAGPARADRRARTPRRQDLGGRGTAIVMPVHNEDPDRWSMALQAMLESLDADGALDDFDLYILSDTRDPNLWVREETAWLRLSRRPAFRNHVFYRRRTENVERKSGNLKDFLELWGHRYRYMIVLDSDSVLEGPSMLEMVRRMDANPNLGLLQVWPQVIGGRTVFGRLQQFSSWLYGRLTLTGMAALLGPHGNYWGHNAIIRIEAFMRHCGLPRLPGKGPLGGEIFSHDFVEAAFLVRGGWEVRIATDIGGSFEDSPPNLPQHLSRDRRWCQGNLQHAWIMVADNIHPVSRCNFLVGILAYVSGPLWCLFLLGSAIFFSADSGLFGSDFSALSIPAWLQERFPSANISNRLLLGATAVFLLAPKIMGLATCAIGQSVRLSRVAGAVVLETLISFLVAPCIMFRHSQYVLLLVLGRKSSWDAPQRDDAKLTWKEAFQALWDLELAGAIIVGLALAHPGPAALWALIVAPGLLLSVPAAVWTGRAKPDGNAAALRLFATPIIGGEGRGETLARTHHLRTTQAQASQRSPGTLDAALRDPVAANLHACILTSGPNAAAGHDAAVVDLAHRRAVREAPPPHAVAGVLSSPASFWHLHLEAVSDSRAGVGRRPRDGTS